MLFFIISHLNLLHATITKKKNRTRNTVIYIINKLIWKKFTYLRSNDKNNEDMNAIRTQNEDNYYFVKLGKNLDINNYYVITTMLSRERWNLKTTFEWQPFMFVYCLRTKQNYCYSIHYVLMYFITLEKNIWRNLIILKDNNYKNVIIIIYYIHLQIPCIIMCVILKTWNIFWNFNSILYHVYTNIQFFEIHYRKKFRKWLVISDQCFPERNITCNKNYFCKMYHLN